MPLRGLAGPGSKFLVQLVNMGHGPFKSPVADAVVEFKWVKFAKRMFLRDLGLSVANALVSV